MCWSTTKRKHIRAHTADENVPIFKICNMPSPLEICAYYMYTRYHLCTLYEIPEIEVERAERTDTGEFQYEIHKGFHSYSDECKAFYNLVYNCIIVMTPCTNVHYFSSDVVLVEGYIPKGSIYYKNSRGEIVSNKIVLTRIVQKDVLDSIYRRRSCPETEESR